MTSKKVKSQSGAQNVKSITSEEFSSEMKPQNKKAEKKRP
jgi:hypothetical protein